MNKLIAPIVLTYGDKSIEGICLVNQSKNYFGNPNAFVSKKSLMDAFPGLTEARIQKAIQRDEFTVKPLDESVHCQRVDALYIDSEIYYKFNRVTKLLDEIAKKRPYIESLRNSYFASCPGKKRSVTTGTISKYIPKSQVIKRLPASLIGEWLKTCQPVETNGEYCASNQCNIAYKEHYDDTQWVEQEEQLLRDFLRLSDEVNKVLWQCDNTTHCYYADFMMDYDNNPSAIVKKLVNFNLIYIDGVVPKPASLNQLFELANKEFNDGQVGTVDDFTRELLDYGFLNKRWDILAALEVGFTPPINRKTYWHKVYSEQLGKENIDYWEWSGNKESREICDELTLLLSLAKPSIDVMLVLKNLPYGQNPFGKSGDSIKTFADLFNRPKFADWEPERKSGLRNSFREWHEQILETIGKDKLEVIYKVCYSVSWEVIEEIIETFSGDWWEILGVAPNATTQEIKNAYKHLAKRYHPDVYPGGGAKMVIINQAFEDSKLQKTKR